MLRVGEAGFETPAATATFARHMAASGMPDLTPPAEVQAL